MDPREVVTTYWESVWTEGNAEVLSDIFAPAVHGNGEPVDVEAFKETVAMWHQICPDFTATIEELIPVGDDRVVSRVTYTGTQKLPWAGLPASGRSFKAVGVDIFRVRGGQIVELWHAVDHLDVATQLGAKLVPAE